MRDRLAGAPVETQTVDVDPNRRENYPASVVVVTYGREIWELRPTLDALSTQTVSSFEVVLVDNGTAWDLHDLQADYDVVSGYVELTENYGVNVGRNLGATLASGDILVFLDDDAVPADDFVESHCMAHHDSDIVAARGRIWPKSESLYNWMAPRYDLGDRVFPHPLDLEGNTSISAAAFDAVSGYDETVFGHEGIHLTAKLLDRYDPEATIYYPDAVVYHDYVDGFFDLVEKKARNDYYRRELQQRRPELFDVYRRYALDPASTPQPSAPKKGLLFGIGVLSDLLAPLARRASSYDRPTRQSPGGD